MKYSLCIRTFLAMLLIASTMVLPNAPAHTYARAAACSVDASCEQNVTVGASASVSGYKEDVNANLADYGLIFQDAAQDMNSSAWDSAANALVNKINSTMAAGSHYNAVVDKTVGPYQGWLEGANVSLIMASGLLLADRGRLNPTLDSAIRRVIGSYVFNRDASCGFSDGRWRGPNNCMDDYTVGATGFAWIAAYKYKRGDSAVSYYSSSAQNLINLSFSPDDSVCIHKLTSTWSASDSRGPCNGAPSDLRAGTAEAISFNHGQETIAYGLGLMTGVSSAFIGLQTANVAISLSNDQKQVALALMKEAQKHTAFDSQTNVAQFLSDCYVNDGSGTALVASAPCGENSYQPKMFPVYTFYTNVLGVAVPGTGYQYDQFDNTLFGDSGFFNRGRQSVYGALTKCWYLASTRPPLGGSPAATPLAEIAFVKPSYASWGPADTLTVGGGARNGAGGVQGGWRGVTANGAWQFVSYQPPPGADTSWSNTIPTSDYCHDYEVYVNYSGTTSPTFLYSGLGSGYCAERSRISWIQPQQTAGFGPVGSLVVSGKAANGPAGAAVKLYWRDVDSNPSGPWNLIDYAAPVGSDGTWYNSIPNVNYAHIYEVYAVYDDAYASRVCRYTGTYEINLCEMNSAAPSNGATVSASSQYSTAYPVSAINDGDRKGLNWGAGGGWNDATYAAYPDWVEVDFNGAQNVDEVDVFTLQDNYGSPIEPVEALTFSAYGITDFNLQYWDDTVGWKQVPGATVAGNNKVWTRLLFGQLTTSKIRVVVNNSLAAYSRITEVEAWGVPTPRYNQAYPRGSYIPAVSASSQYSAGYPVSAINNGDRKGLNWASGGGWNDATAGDYTNDWVEVDFPGGSSKLINEINVVTLQDNYGNPVEPTEATTFSAYGITDFDVQYKSGGSRGIGSAHC